MKNTVSATVIVILSAAFMSSIAFGAPVAQVQRVDATLSYEDWKGPVEDSEMKFGFLLGMGTLDSSAGFTVLGTVSKRILTGGFVPDINNPVSIEFQGGPLFVNESRSFAYSTHLRWDFRRDEEWTFYALGGFAGHITSDELGGRFLLFPRFGVGAMMDTSLGMAVRAELSHEFITMGLVWSI